MHKLPRRSDWLASGNRYQAGRIDAPTNQQLKVIAIDLNNPPPELGRLGLGGTRWVYSAEGFVINLGSRLANLAQAGQILICPESARPLAGTYQLYALGPQKLQGIAEAMEVYRLEAAHG
jgi:hypothetical protein